MWNWWLQKVDYKEVYKVINYMKDRLGAKIPTLCDENMNLAITIKEKEPLLKKIAFTTPLKDKVRELALASTGNAVQILSQAMIS